MVVTVRNGDRRGRNRAPAAAGRARTLPRTRNPGDPDRQSARPGRAHGTRRRRRRRGTAGRSGNRRAPSVAARPIRDVPGTERLRSGRARARGMGARCRRRPTAQRARPPRTRARARIARPRERQRARSVVETRHFRRGLAALVELPTRAQRRLWRAMLVPAPGVGSRGTCRARPWCLGWRAAVTGRGGGAGPVMRRVGGG